MNKFLASAGPVGKTLQFGPSSDQDSKTLYPMIIYKDFFKFNHLIILVRWGTIDSQKVTIVGKKWVLKVYFKSSFNIIV